MSWRLASASACARHSRHNGEDNGPAQRRDPVASASDRSVGKADRGRLLTTSAFAWLDYSDGERRRMLEVIELFREKGTLDELGIGSIRDTFADHFFPGISTIQTRARYFL